MKTSTPKGNHPSRPARKACSRPVKPALLGVCLLSALFSTASAQLFTDVPGLSAAGQNALVTHFDGRVGVSVNGNGGVTAWQGRDGNGNLVVTANRSGNAGDDSDTNNNITRNASNSALVFTESDTNQTAHLLAELFVTDSNMVTSSMVTGGEYTILWRGSYSGSNPQSNGSLGRYAYNLTTAEPNVIWGGFNHQRRDANPVVASYVQSNTGGSAQTVRGDNISALNDTPTVWTSLYNYTSPGGTIDFRANGDNLNVQDINAGQGTQSFASTDEPYLYIGAISHPFGLTSSGGGFSFIGEMEQLIIFEGNLSSTDIAAVESYLTAIPEPSTYALLLTFGAAAYLVLRPRLRRGR